MMLKEQGDYPLLNHQEEHEMRIVRFEAYMESAQWNIHPWVAAKRSYPLPSYSTVIGMIHTLCNWNTYHPMRVSVCGLEQYNQGDICIRYQGGLRAKTLSEEFEKRFPVIVPDQEGYTGFVKSNTYENFVNDISLRIHILPDCDEDIETVYNALCFPPVYPSLGRREDLMRIDEISITEIGKCREKVSLDMCAYIPAAQCEEVTGIHYNLKKDYKIVNSRRVFNEIETVLASAETNIAAHIDTDGNPVFLA